MIVKLLQISLQEYSKEFWRKIKYFLLYSNYIGILCLKTSVNPKLAKYVHSNEKLFTWSFNTGVPVISLALELALDWPLDNEVPFGVAEEDPEVVVPAVPAAPDNSPGAVFPIMFM